MRLMIINSVLGYGSTGKIAEQIALVSQKKGWECRAVHGVKYSLSSSLRSDPIGNRLDLCIHEAKSLLLDAHGTGSGRATENLCSRIAAFDPDIIHLHNIHGYYLNYPILFKYLASIGRPIVWTLHDCWPFTGHCCYFDRIGCDRWKTGCGHCPGLSVYPKSLFLDRSARNYLLKEESFTSVINRLTLVPVSDWLETLVRQSFLKEASIQTIHNGLNVNIFSPKEVQSLREKYSLGNKKVILGVALPWTTRKGFEDMLKIAAVLPSNDFQVMMVGLSEKQLKQLPSSIIGIKKTNSVEELAELYSLATVFINPTYEDNFPTVNIEALACGTPVITYRTGGSPEAIDAKTGLVVERGDVKGLAAAIEDICTRDRARLSKDCRARAEQEFDKDKCFGKYVDLYEVLMGRKLHKDKLDGRGYADKALRIEINS